MSNDDDEDDVFADIDNTVTYASRNHIFWISGMHPAAHSGRITQRVVCATCNMKLAESTTSAMNYIKNHLQDMQDRVIVKTNTSTTFCEYTDKPVRNVIENNRCIMPELAGDKILICVIVCLTIITCLLVIK